MSSFITSDEFNALHAKEQQELPALKWIELPLNIIYRVHQCKEVLVDDMPTMILTLVEENGNTLKLWAPGRLRDRIHKNYRSIANLYVRSLGIKDSKTVGRWYYSYELVQLHT